MMLSWRPRDSHMFLFYLTLLQRVIQVSNAISFGLKEGDWYAWYGVWDIWRRIPFVALTTGMIGANNTLVCECALNKCTLDYWIE